VLLVQQHLHAVQPLCLSHGAACKPLQLLHGSLSSLDQQMDTRGSSRTAAGLKEAGRMWRSEVC